MTRTSNYIIYREWMLGRSLKDLAKKHGIPKEEILRRINQENARLNNLEKLVEQDEIGGNHDGIDKGKE